jgi:hypothetical protein
MELEDLKGMVEAASAKEAPAKTAEELERDLAGLAGRYRRSFALRAALEFLAGGLVFLLVLAFVFVVGKPLASFQVKLVIIAAGGYVAMAAMFGRHFARVRAASLSLSARAHLEMTLAQQKRLLRIYTLAAETVCLIYAVVFWSDASFRALSLGWKAATTAYLAVFAVLVRPYVRWLYGRRLRALEEQLRGWTE